MQETVYKCDNCQKIIGNKKHISTSFGPYSGIAHPPGKNGPTWQVHNKLNGRFLHFCNGKCIGEYFRKLLNPKK